MQKKPNPYFIERAMSDLDADAPLYVGDREGQSPSNSRALPGDSESDIRAAANAGVDSAFLRRDHRSDTTLSIQPTYEIDDLWDLERIVR